MIFGLAGSVVCVCVCVRVVYLIYGIEFLWLYFDGFWPIVLDEIRPISLCVGFSY
jgi:hypothetical protein